MLWMSLKEMKDMPSEDTPGMLGIEPVNLAEQLEKGIESTIIVIIWELAHGEIFTIIYNINISLVR